MIEPVTFAGDPLASQLQNFVAALASSTYWVGSLAEYGVGDASVVLPPGPVTAPASNTFADADVRNAILSVYQQTLQGGGTFSAAETIMAVYLPPGGTFVDPSLLGTSQNACSVMGGYHAFLLLPDGERLAYAVTIPCPNFAPDGLGGWLSGLDYATGASSHEIAETATDPFDVDHADPTAAPEPGWFLTSDPSFALIGEVEVGDLCVNTGSPFYQPPGLGFTVQHLWSNAAAQAGDDPCGEATTAQPFFDAVPVLSAITLAGFGQPLSTPGLSIPVGQTRTVDLDLFSSGPTSPWTIETLAWDGVSPPGPSQDLSLALDVPTGANGDVRQLTVTVNQAGSFLGVASTEMILVLSTSATGQITLWPLIVQNP